MERQETPLEEPSSLEMAEFVPPLTREERVWAVVAHVGGLVCFLLPAGRGLVNFVVPLSIRLGKAERSAGIAVHAGDALNFQLCALIAWAAVILLTGKTWLVRDLLLWLVAISNAVFSLVAGIHAWDGRRYQYPLSFRFVR